MKAQLEGLAFETAKRAEKHREETGEGELYCYLMGKVQGLLDAAALIGE